MIKKIGLFILSIIGVLLLVLCILYFTYNQPLPKTTPSAEADCLAKKMLDKLRYNKYKETTFLEWTFNGGKHQYNWNKTKGIVIVKWNTNTVHLSLKKPLLSIAYQKELLVNDKTTKNDLIKTATKYFNNDSFWLVAPFKIFDKGTTRSVILLEDNKKGLLVTYSSGGTTPGDTYLWKFDENGFPNSYQMWTSIIPIGGLEASWEDWKLTKTGVFLPGSHKIGPLTLFMGEVKTYN